jgi:hypothetical protein
VSLEPLAVVSGPFNNPGNSGRYVDSKTGLPTKRILDDAFAIGDKCVTPTIISTAEPNYKRMNDYYLNTFGTKLVYLP